MVLHKSNGAYTLFLLNRKKGGCEAWNLSTPISLSLSLSHDHLAILTLGLCV